MSLSLVHIDDGEVLRLITKAITAAVENTGEKIQVLNFGEPLPKNLILTAAVAGMDLEPIDSRLVEGEADVAMGTIAIEAMADPAVVKDCIYKLPWLASKVAIGLLTRSPYREPESGELGTGHQIDFLKRFRRGYRGAPPEEPRNLKICRLEAPIRVTRAAGNSIVVR